MMTHAPHGGCSVALPFKRSVTPGSASTFPFLSENFPRTGRLARASRASLLSWVPRPESHQPLAQSHWARMVDAERSQPPPGCLAVWQLLRSTLQPQSWFQRVGFQVCPAFTRRVKPLPFSLGALNKAGAGLGWVGPRPGPVEAKLGEIGRGRRRRRRRRRGVPWQLRACCGSGNRSTGYQLLHTLSLCIALSSP
jgi:hypothetical protein